MDSFDKKSLSETDIRTKFITPAIASAGWDLSLQMREEYKISNGRIIARGKVCKRESSFARCFSKNSNGLKGYRLFCYIYNG